MYIPSFDGVSSISSTTLLLCLTPIFGFMYSALRFWQLKKIKVEEDRLSLFTANYLKQDDNNTQIGRELLQDLESNKEINMKLCEIYDAITTGAKAFLSAEYKYMYIFLGSL